MSESAESPGHRLLNSARLAVAMGMEGRAAWRSRDRLATARDSRVRAMVRYAYRHVPYYQETLRRLGLTPRDFQTAADLRRLPFIDPKEVHLDPGRFTAQGVDRGDWLALDSSGSTGTSRVVYVDGASLLRNTAHGVRDRQVVPGVGARLRRQSGQTVVADVRRMPFRPGLFDCVLSNSTLDHFAEKGEAALARRGILAVPDFVANCGGVLGGTMEFAGWRAAG